MIAFSGTIGNGLFLGSGKSLASAGPGGAVVAYVLMGTVISSVISCLGEMTALMPVNAPVMEFPRRFVSRGVGFAVGWIYWLGDTPHTPSIWRHPILTFLTHTACSLTLRRKVRICGPRGSATSRPLKRYQVPVRRRENVPELGNRRTGG
jgi:hypothetical protein